LVDGSQVVTQSTLYFVPKREFERVETLDLDRAERAELFATLCRANALYMIANAGSGHIGSSFSSLDLVSWLFLNELRTDNERGGLRDVYFSSKGHDVPGLYSVLLGRGLLSFELIHGLRRLGGLPGHPDVGTPYMHTNTGPLGMGISKAKGMALANRAMGTESRIFVLTGDGELQEGQFWESLGSASNRGLGEITAIVDHNKIQSDTWVEKVSGLGDLDAKFRAFGWHTERIDGHDFAAMEEVFTRLRLITDIPKLIIADTIKGSGVSFMQHTAMSDADKFYRFHSGAPDDTTYHRALEEIVTNANRILRAAGASTIELDERNRPDRPDLKGRERLVAAYSNALVAIAEKNPNIVVLDADLVLDCGLIPFSDRFPDRFFECGIAEQDMVSQAGGMALKGMLPIVHSFACFLSTRPNEQIYNNATEKKKIIYVGALAGILPSGPGHSHQSVRDISALGAIPGLTLLEPSCEREVGLALEYAVNRERESVYLRLVSVPTAVPFELPASYQLTKGRGVTLLQGRDAIIFAYGPVLLGQAYDAALRLRLEQQVEVTLINLPWLNTIDWDWLRETLADFDTVVTLDNHYIAHGQGAMLAATISGLRQTPPPLVVMLGVSDIPACGQNDEVLRIHGLDSGSIFNAVIEAREQTHAAGTA
jgi:transketolase